MRWPSTSRGSCSACCAGSASGSAAKAPTAGRLRAWPASLGGMTLRRRGRRVARAAKPSSRVPAQTAAARHGAACSAEAWHTGGPLQAAARSCRWPWRCPSLQRVRQGGCGGVGVPMWRGGWPAVMPPVSFCALRSCMPFQQSGRPGSLHPVPTHPAKALTLLVQSARAAPTRSSPAAGSAWVGSPASRRASSARLRGCSPGGGARPGWTGCRPPRETSCLRHRCGAGGCGNMSFFPWRNTQPARRVQVEARKTCACSADWVMQICPD